MLGVGPAPRIVLIEIVLTVSVVSHTHSVYTFEGSSVFLLQTWSDLGTRRWFLAHGPLTYAVQYYVRQKNHDGEHCECARQLLCTFFL